MTLACFVGQSSRIICVCVRVSFSFGNASRTYSGWTIEKYSGESGEGKQEWISRGRFPWFLWKIFGPYYLFTISFCGRCCFHIQDFQDFIKRIGGMFRCPSFRRSTTSRMFHYFSIVKISVSHNVPNMFRIFYKYPGISKVPPAPACQGPKGAGLGLVAFLTIGGHAFQLASYAFMS